MSIEMTKNSYLTLLLLTLLSMFAAGFGYGAQARQDPTSTPEATATEVPPFQRSLLIADAWQELEVEAHGLKISYPPGWMFVGPTREDSAAFLAVSDSPFLAEELREIPPEPVLRVDSGLVGLSIHLQSRESAELAAGNNISVDVVPAEGDTLHRRLQGIASYLRRVERVELDRVGVVTGLRPQGEAAGSIRFDEGGNGLGGEKTAVWVVIVESADAEAHLVFRFEILAEEFDSLKPLLSEIVYRVRWDGQTTVTQPSAAQPSPPSAVVDRTTGVRSGPGEESPVIGWVTGGLQIELVRPDPSGDWWLAAYKPATTTESTDSAAESAGQLGWVSAQAVTAVSAQGATVGEDSTTSQSAHSVPVTRLTNPFAPPWDRGPEEEPEADTAWEVFEERGRQLSIFFPQGWLFFEAGQPSYADLAELSAALGERVTAADIGGLVPVLVDQSWTGTEGDSPATERTVWISFQRAAIPDSGFLAAYTSADDLTLEQIAQRVLVNLYTNPNHAAFEIESAGIVSGLRPGDEEVISLRYRADGLSDEKESVAVWQVLLLSPDSESILTFDFFVPGEEFPDLEPLLREIVWRMRWEEQLRPDSLAGPAVSVGRPMNVRGGPGTDNPVIGTAFAGERFPIVGRNAAGDWWQIYLDEGLGWIYGGLVAAIGDTQEVRRADPSGWLEMDDGGVGVVLSYPAGWFFFDPAQPTPADLAAFSAEAGARVDADGMAALVARMTGGQGDAVVGLGLEVGRESSNFVVALAYEANGMTVPEFAQRVAVDLGGGNGITVGDSGAQEGAGTLVELVTDLREGEEVVAVRLREDGSMYEGFQYWLLSPDGETLIAVVSSIFGKDMPDLEPVLEEMVGRLRWTEPAAEAPGVVSLLTVDRELEVRRGPAKIYAVMGAPEAGQQLTVNGRNFDGSWWQVKFQGRTGWVFGQDLDISDAESVQVAEGVPTPTPTPTATPAPDLARLIETPQSMAYLWWHWGRDRDFAGDEREGIRELTFDFTVHNDPGDFSDGYGLFLMLCSGSIGDVRFYFGLQTDVANHPEHAGGKAIVLSRWGTRDLAHARIADGKEGWADSSGHEGDFIGVRHSYNWGEGEYRVVFTPDGADSDGKWYGVWITDKATYETTWIGSLKFPYENGIAAIGPSVHTAIEVYGGTPIQAFRIPEWHVSLKRPLADGLESEWIVSGYADLESWIANADVRYDRADGEVHILAGGAVERTMQAQEVKFE